MDELDLNNVRAFLETARQLSFSEAARVLGLSQPAVSMRVKALEDQLEACLFERGPSGTRLTASGESFVAVADQLLRFAARAQESLRTEKRDLTGRLTLACSSSAGKYPLPELVASYLRQFPEVDVLISVVSREEMESSLRKHAVDLGVTSSRSESNGFEYSPFFVDHLSLIVPSSHPWARRREIPAEELIGERFICREPESSCRRVVRAGLQPLGVDLSDLLIVMEVGSAEALAMAVERGIGLAFVSTLAAQPRARLGRLAMVDIARAKLTNQIEWVRPATHPASPELSAFLEMALDPDQQTIIQSLVDSQLL